MKAHFYQIEYSKKDNGWVPKYRTKTYKHLRVPKSPAFPTIEEVEEWIRETYIPSYRSDRPWIDHKIGTSSGHLMTLEDWKSSCDAGGFIDYDGYGNAVDENYQIICSNKKNSDYFDDMICPSDYTKRGGKNIPPETKYILWYNR